MKRFVFLYIIYISLITGEAQVNKNQPSTATRIAEEKCGKYIYKAVRPLLEYIHQMKDEIQNNNKKVEGNDRQIKQLQEKLNQHNELVIEALKELTKNVSSIKEEVGKPTSNPLKLQKYEEQLEKQKKSIDEKDQQIAEIKNQVNICAKNLKSYEEKLVYSECTDIADSPGIHKIKPDQEEPFDVLCDSATAGPGWTVIQQRINGKENFNRDWKTYRAGFGDFVGDFFLGLENIHRLTNSQPHELYIYMEDFDGIIKYYRYEQFTIAGEDDLYRLRISDKAVGNATRDALIYLNYQQFTTFDRDNDVDVYANCAKDYGGGWWYRFCIRSSLNGKYYDYNTKMSDGILWDGESSLKKVKMLIRPKSYEKSN